MNQMTKNNIMLIGMPGAGKSTLGVLLAKTMGFDFIDTDIIIQKKHGALLQTIVDENGYDGFVKIEEDTILSLKLNNTVISPGGSIVYSDCAMKYMQKEATIFYLNVPFELLEERLKNIATRGVLLKKDQTFESLYKERVSLYEKYAHHIVKCDGKGIEQIIEEILKFI